MRFRELHNLELIDTLIILAPSRSQLITPKLDNDRAAKWQSILKNNGYEDSVATWEVII